MTSDGIETPPLAWRKRVRSCSFRGEAGNTSTGVEKTLIRKILRFIYKKHLHWRGENRLRFLWQLYSEETPPLAWRKLGVAFKVFPCDRNTSTGVEKTLCWLGLNRQRKKHLHWRGENCVRPKPAYEGGETPPLAWRKHPLLPGSSFLCGNTSTGVEKT